MQQIHSIGICQAGAGASGGGQRLFSERPLHVVGSEEGNRVRTRSFLTAIAPTTRSFLTAIAPTTRSFLTSVLLCVALCVPCAPPHVACSTVQNESDRGVRGAPAGQQRTHSPVTF